MAERKCAVCGGPITEKQEPRYWWKDHGDAVNAVAHREAEDCVAHVRATMQAEINRLKERNGYLEDKMERALASVAHFTHRYNEDRAEIDRLRKIIADAPHENDCQMWLIVRGVPEPCDCWKSRVDQAAAAR